MHCLKSLLVTVLFTAAAAAQPAPAGVTLVPLDPGDPDPIVVLPSLPVFWNDIHFQLPNPPGLKKEDVKLKDENGANLDWTEPTESPAGSGKYSMEKGSNGTQVNAGKGASLDLQSKTGGGWSNVKYSRTRNGKTFYASVAIPEGGTAVTYTGNSFPVTLGALVLITNNASQAISSIHLAVDTSQSFTEIGSDNAGIGVPADGDFVFDSPLETGDSTTLFWTYDGFSTSPEADTEVTITATFTSGLLSLASGQGRTRLSRLASPRATLPPLLLREARRDGFGREIRLSSGGAYRFVAAGRVQRTEGQVMPGVPYIDAAGDLCIPLTGESATRCAWNLSGVEIDTSATPIGPVRLFLGNSPSIVGTVVGFRGNRG